jgi:hypothetical protein
MNFVSDFIYWLGKFSWLLTDENLQGLLRGVAAIATILFSLITFYLKLKEKRGLARAQLAVSSTSWDSQSRFPIYPLPTNFKSAPFPFVAAALSTRTRGPKGWFTVTELRVWNAGQEPLWGRAFNSTVDVHIAIDAEVGGHALRACLSNDASARVHVGRIIHAASGQKRLPIDFDILRPGKGILVQIWHNAQDGSNIRINAIADHALRTLTGVHFAISPKVVRFMSTMTLWLLLPAAALTVLFMISRDTAAAAASGVFTWVLILAAYLHWKLKPVAPEDLGIRSEKAKIFFYHGPG